ncbi:MAG: CotH kinase family protein [Prevotella sp.]|nr:CotH kinase family protein [Prevotella sp.]
MTRQRNFILLTAITALPAAAQEAQKLSGTVIGTELSYDYSAGGASTTVNTRENAFDGDLSTFFATNTGSLGWCGLDLGTPHIITRVGWSPRDASVGEERVVLAVFEGANEADFSDAVPLFLNDAAGTIGAMTYADVNVSRAFRYVRYVGPNNSHCNIAEAEFYGYEGEGSDECFYRPTNLPLVSVHIENDAEPQDKINDLNCTITLIPADGSEAETASATIRLRGNASMNFPKKPYRIKFDKKRHVFSSPASAKKWTLINNYGDKTLMRNILAFEVSRRFGMAYTPFCTPVDVMVNGEYKGCYQLCDQVEVGNGRVEVEEMDEDCTSGELLTGGYLVEIDAYAYDEDNYFYSNKGTPVTVKYPDSDDITTEQNAYIRSQFNTMEAAVYASDFTSDATGYRAWLDITSFLQFFLVGEFTGNTDTFWSTNMSKRRSDERFYTGPVWDFDIAFENDNRTYPINSHSDFAYTFGSHAGDMLNFVNRIIKSDSRTLGELQEMWADARRNKGMTPDSFLEYVDETACLLDASQRLNFLRWPILSTMVHQNWQAAGTYEGEVEVVKNYIRDRFDWLDDKLSFDAAGIKEIDASAADENSMIFTLDGRCAGTNPAALCKGVYVKAGKKFVVK